ncbi:hypothetical protein BDEG_21406 [Batrachochytrium dendrobatidis JEL423]|uniref:Uncharacterized protein n=1 Tax=Batrachochytrium dendrobatidis (strain JEL423) TaxID=403673 RepID=A0A177WCC1_BATDL|nr:hypothetical protein BDEG_21406 [Batrachochytrium dendrobatidis JEL423]
MVAHYKQSTTTANAILIPSGNDRSTQTSGTSSQVSDPTDKPSPGTSNEYQQEPMDLSISNRYRQQLVDLTISNKYKQEPVDESNSDTSDEYQQEPMDLSISSRIQQQPIDQLSPSTSSQNQQQPVNHDESSNTVTNQIAGLSRKYQITFDRIKQKLAVSKKIRKEKHKEYSRYADLGLEQQTALAIGKEISESKYDPDTEKKLKQEYEKAGAKISIIRQQLKRFMKRHGLEFEEPKADSD